MAGVLLQVLVGALLLGLGVSVSCRVGRPRPALCHGLWLVVVVKLLVPPFVAWPWQPEGGLWENMAFPARARVLMPGEPVAVPALPGFAIDAPSGSAPVAPEAETAGSGPAYWLFIPDGGGDDALVRVPLEGASILPRPEEQLFTPAPAVAESSGRAGWEAGTVVGLAALGLWFGGALVSVGVHAARIRRFRRAMRSSEPGPAWLKGRVAEIAEAFSVRAPEVLVADGLWSAMVWGVIRPAILVPRRALEDLEPARWETVVAHELAHLKRRDHWAAWVVLVASCVWWWNPVLWWARRRIADYAEMACDAWVLWALPERGREYADTLVHFVQAHSARSSSSTTPAVVPDPMPCMSSDNARAFKRRLAAILLGPRPSRLGVAGVMCLVALAAVVLPVFSQQDAGPAPEAVEPIPPAVEAAEPVVAVQALPEPAPKPPGETARPEPALPEPAPAPPDETAGPEPAPPEPPQALEPTLRPQPQPQPPQRPDPFNIGTPSEKMQQALDAPVSLDFTDFHIMELAEFVTETYEVNVVVDWRVVQPPRQPGAAAASAHAAASADVAASVDAGAPAEPAARSAGAAQVVPGLPGAFPGARGLPGGGMQQMPQPPGVTPTGYVTDGMVNYVSLRKIPLRDALTAVLRTVNLTFVTYPNLLFFTSNERALADSFLPRPGLPPYKTFGDALSPPVSLEFGDTHIAEIIEFVSETYELNFMIDWRVVSKPGTPAAPDTPKVSTAQVPAIMVRSAPLGEVLDVLLRSINLTFYPEKNYIWISSLEGGGATGGFGGAALALEPTVAPQAQQGAEQTQGEPVQVQRPGETQQAPEPPKAEPGQAQEASQGQQPLEPAQAQGPSETEKAPATQALGLVLHASRVADPFNVGTVSEELKEALSSEVSLDFTDVHLTDFVDYISNTYGVNIVIDWRVVEAPRPRGEVPGAVPGVRGHVLAEGCVTDGVVPYLKLTGVRLLEAVRVFTRGLNLTVVTYPHILFITSEERALADLSLPRPGLPPYASSSLGEVLSSEVSLDFHDVHIANFTQFVSETYGVNIMPDWRVIPRPGVSPASAYTPKVSPARVPRILVTAAPLGETLDVVLRSINLTFYPERNYIWISSFGGVGASGGSGGGGGFPGMPGVFPGGAAGRAFGGVGASGGIGGGVSGAYGGGVAGVSGGFGGGYGGVSSSSGSRGAAGREGGLPYFEVVGVLQPNGVDPDPGAVIRIPGTGGQPTRTTYLRLNETLDGIRFVGFLPDGKGIVVERVDEPGKTYQVGPPQQLLTPVSSASAAGGFGGGIGGGVSGGFGGGVGGTAGGAFGVGAGRSAFGGGGVGGGWSGSRFWDTFDAADAGAWPSAWIPDGNCENSGACYVDGSTFGPAHGKVLRLMGEGAGWSPIAHVEANVGPPFRISFDVFMDGADKGGECVVGVRERPDWQAPGVLLFSAPLSGPARALEPVAAEGKVQPGQTTDQVHLEPSKWYRVVLDLKQDSGRDQLTVTVDDGQKVQGPVELSAEGILVKDMPYLQLEMRTGVAWFDNVIMMNL